MATLASIVSSDILAFTPGTNYISRLGRMNGLRCSDGPLSDLFSRASGYALGSRFGDST
jgi:hypothetical protein